MKKITLITSFFLLFAIVSNAQEINTGSSYKTAIGVKVFDGGGVSLKTFVKNNTALEGLLYFWNKGTRVTGLYEIHGDIAGAEGLKWYVGPGAHLAFYNSNYGGGAVIGVDGVLGLDYKIKGIPLNISFDWNPNVDFGSTNGFNAGAGGLGIRYTF
ncbi:MAG: hypothetical protein C0459_14805 [Chitinophaga sp.]|jgi:hypothetical protein|nr:hypothetical protein [Chitinophaga sp.]